MSFRPKGIAHTTTLPKTAPEKSHNVSAKVIAPCLLSQRELGADRIAGSHVF